MNECVQIASTKLREREALDLFGFGGVLDPSVIGYQRDEIEFLASSQWFLDKISVAAKEAGLVCFVQEIDPPGTGEDEAEIEGEGETSRGGMAVLALAILGAVWAG